MAKYKVIHYINQFYAGIGGEDKADWGLEIVDGIKGPGLALKAALGNDFEIVSTIFCGDNTVSNNTEKIVSEIMEIVKKVSPDILIAGPAFNAGRYGPICGAVCKAAMGLGIPAVTGMYEENPGTELYKKDCYIVSTKDSAAGMRDAVKKIAALASKLVAGESVDPKTDNYYVRMRKNVFVEKNGAERAFDMLLKKLNGEPFETELKMTAFEIIPPAAPVTDLKNAKLALVTDAGLTDKSNSFKLESSRATKYVDLSIEGMESLSPDLFSANHGGYDNTQANINPNVIVPLDIVREFQKKGAFAELSNHVYSTTGNGTSLKNAQKFGSEIAARLKKEQVDAVILTST